MDIVVALAFEIGCWSTCSCILWFDSGLWVYAPKGPSAQIVGFQGPKTIQSMDFGIKDPAIWVLGPSGY